MRKIQKIGVYFLMLILSAVVAGIYGMLHDQISYTFSEEYFTQFKFKQFGIPWAYEAPRLGAAYVGAIATWWMGILVSIVLGFFGFMFHSPRQMVRSLSKSFLVVIVVALLTGFAGLALGYYQVNEQTVSQYIQWIRPGVSDPVQFVRVGFMHNASYLGGLTGLLSGIVYLVISKLRYNKLNLQDAQKTRVSA
ncbi:signal peptide-containing protein [Pseudoalteromonas rubra]|uniref:Signal peptide-containing protein n=1 Tax=Pseudoalteromonas rubra TaxID=43658 RepID=A0A5S3WGQ0_9GAMM|nr:signal peptide-containing protein [Pseudoalteromonas rubra]TMP23093.1 signal peptide-containing protein [Pseudoalteromonas rubra]TMP26801.1 signal peptide-containing protein [Pseudoalteromonas rubra]